MALYENIYSILSRINEAELNKKGSEASTEFFNKENLKNLIDGLMDKHDNDIEKVMSELNSHINSLKNVKDGYSIKEDGTSSNDYRYGGMEIHKIREKDLRAWEKLSKEDINVSIIGNELKLLDPNKKRAFKIISKPKLDEDGEVLIPVRYFITIKDKETSKIHNKYSSVEYLTARELKSLIDNPINAEILKNSSIEPYDFSDMKAMIKDKQARVLAWKNSVDTVIGDLSPDLQYMAYVLCELEGYPLSVIQKFLHSDRATPENLETVRNYYRINLANNPYNESVLFEAKYPEPVYKVDARGEEGKIATMALKQLDPKFFMATTLSIPYSLTPVAPVKQLNPFQKAKVAKDVNVRIVAVPYNLANLLLEIIPEEDGITVNEIDGVNIPEDEYKLYVQPIDGSQPFAVSIAKLREFIDASNGRFEYGALTPDEQEELLSTRNFTQKGVGGKQIPISEDQIKHILTQMHSVSPFNIIFEGPEEIIAIYENNRDKLSKETTLIKRILSEYVRKALSNEYAGVFEKGNLSPVKAMLTKSGVAYNAVLPLSPEPLMKFKPSKSKTIATSINDD